MKSFIGPGADNTRTKHIGARRARSFNLLSDYELRNLPRHCVEANRIEDLHRLLSASSNGANAWFEIKDARGMASEYLSDLELARKLAQDEYTARGSAEFLGRVVLYALMGSTLSQVSSNVHVVLLDALIRTGIWSVSQATAYARKVADPVQYPIAAAVIVKYADNDRKRALVDEILRAVEGITIPVTDRFHEDTQPTDLRVGVVIDILPIIPEQYLSEILALLNRENQWQVMISGAAIVESIPSSFLPLVIPWIANMRPSVAARFVVAIAKKTPDLDVRAIAYEVGVKSATAAYDVCYEEEYVALLSLLKRRLRQQLYRTVLTLAPGKLQNEALLAIGHYAHEFRRSEASQFERHIRSIKSSPQRREVQAILRAYADITGGAGVPKQEPAFRGQRRYLSRQREIDILLKAAGWVERSLRKKLLDRAVISAAGIRHRRSRADAFVQIALSCIGRQRVSLFERALREIAAIDNVPQRGGALDYIMPHLGRGYFQQCLSIFRTLGEYDRTLCKAGHFHGRRMGVPCTTSLLADIAEGVDLHTLVEDLLGMRDARCRTVALCAVMPKLSGPELARVARECLASARTIGDELEVTRLSAWLALYQPRSAAVRKPTALPYLTVSFTSSGEEEVYDDPGTWLSALRNREARANLAECYLRHYCRKHSNLDLHRLRHLLTNLRDGRKKVLVRLMTRRISELQAPERHQRAFEALLGMAGFPTAFVEPLIGPVEETGCHCAWIYYQCERLTWLAGAERHEAARALVPIRINKLCLQAPQPAFACGFALVDPQLASLRRELATLPWVAKSKRRRLLRRLAKKLHDPDADGVASTVLADFPVDAPADVKKWLSRQLLRRIPKKDRPAFVREGLLVHLPKKRAKKLAIAAAKASSSHIDDIDVERAERRAVRLLLQAGLIARTLEMARSMDRQNTRSETLARISFRVEGQHRAGLLSEALDELSSVRDTLSRHSAALAIAEAAHLLEGEDKRRIVAAWLKQLGSHDRSVALSELKQVSILVAETDGVAGIHATLDAAKRVSQWWR